MTQIRVSIQSKGGPGSGNWGHRGIPGKVGGSSPRGAGMSPTSGKDWLQRYEKRAGKKHPTAAKKPAVKLEPKIAFGERGPKGGTPSRPNARASVLLNIGLQGRSWSEATVDDELDARLDAVNTIATKTGVADDAVLMMVESWAFTSNDNDPMALSMQQAAAEEFNVPLSKWQRDIIKVVESDIGKPVSGNVSREQERAVLRAMYDTTQATLRKYRYRPGDVLVLSRGVGVGVTKGPGTTSKGSEVNFVGNTMESWTASVDIAREYAKYAQENFGSGISLSMGVPIENILSLPMTGFGDIGSGEFVILGTVASNIARVV